MFFRLNLVIFLILFSISEVFSAKGQIKCGKKSTSFGTVFGGDHTSVNAWPWLVAFWFKPKDAFFCGGSLVSAKHILSAAHCFHEKYEPVKKEPEEVTALVGKHNLRIKDEEGSVVHEILDVIIHKDWNYTEDKYDADIALVVLVNEVDLKQRRFARIVCLPLASEKEMAGVGTVVGWGVSSRSEANQEKHDTTPNEVDLPAIPRAECFKSTNHLLASSNRTFCAGYENRNKASCSGDSGGGFYQFDPSNEAFTINGIVSASIRDSKLSSCRIDTYSIFTDVTKFVDWLKINMERSKNARWREIEFDCDFQQERNYQHRCRSKQSGSNTSKSKIYQEYEHAATLEKLLITFGKSENVFVGIGENFPRLKDLWIFSNGILKIVEKQHFENMGGLEKLDLSSNNIQSLQENVFEELVGLKNLTIEYNYLETVPENIFKNLQSIKEISLAYNNIVYLPKNLLVNNVNLEVFSISGNPLKKLNLIPATSNVKFVYDD